MWKSISLLFLFAVSCASQPDISKTYSVHDWQELYRLPLDYSPDKCLYSFVKDTAYIMNKKAAQIDIFHKGKKQNTIGGKGMGHLSFTNLSDIALAMDGTIFALDSFQKTIKRFDENGGFITQLQVSDLAYPTLFDVTSDEIFYLFDEDRSEIAILRRGSKIERFGKFTLQKPTLLIASRNVLTIYDEAVDKTFFFSTFGNLLEERNGLVMLEKDNYFLLQPFFIESMNTKEKYAISPTVWERFIIKADAVTLLSQNAVLIGRFFYETKH